jgi:hypothetical protein
MLYVKREPQGCVTLTTVRDREDALASTRDACATQTVRVQPFLRYGRGRGVGRNLGEGQGLGVDVGVGVGVAVAVGVDVAVGVGVGVVPVCTSNEPMSIRPSTTRSKPWPL